MPLFEFRCGRCKAEFEVLTKGDDSVACPHCGAKRVSRLLSRFAVSRQLTPCGTPAAESIGSCAFDPNLGGCPRCLPD